MSWTKTILYQDITITGIQNKRHYDQSIGVQSEKNDEKNIIINTLPFSMHDKLVKL